MTHVLLDTHAWAWSLTADKRLSARAVEAIESAESVAISAISVYEIGRKVQLGKWPDMEPFLHELVGLAEEQGARLVELSADIALKAATLQWEHRDQFDRILAATALRRGLLMVSADLAFDGLDSEQAWVGRVW